MSNLLVMNEGPSVDDYNHLIIPTFVDLREPENRLPIRTLIKGCRKEYAIELCKKIRISKPEQFRKYGEGLILDPAEAYVSHIEVDTEILDVSHEIAEDQLLNDEFAKASELLQSNVKFTNTTRSKERTHKTTDYLSFGKNGWIYSTSIEPISQAEKDSWRESIPDEYDYVSYIHRPREFARALGSMVAEQLGPQGKEEEMKHSFDEIHRSTFHRNQIIYHGPVIYVEDPYTAISNASSKVEFIFRSIFVKGLKFQDQREYRFAIWSEQEPSAETVDLDVSFAMLGSMRERVEGPVQSVHPTSTPPNRPADSRATGIENGGEPVTGEMGTTDSLFPGMRSRHPSPAFSDSDWLASVMPIVFDMEDLPHALHEMTATYSAVVALRTAVQNLERKRRAQAAGSAWHAEILIRRLCSIFEDPIETFSISDNNFIVATIKFPDESQSEAKIAIGPTGSCTFETKFNGESRTSFSETVWSLREKIGSELEEVGLRARPSSSAMASDSLSNSN